MGAGIMVTPHHPGVQLHPNTINITPHQHETHIKTPAANPKTKANPRRLELNPYSGNISRGIH
jgi:hypothetical protein